MRRLRRLNPWVIEGRYAEDIPDASAAVARGLVDLAGEVLRCVELAILEQGDAR